MRTGPGLRSLRWKILLMALLIVFIPIYLLNRHALQFFDVFTRTDLEADLKHYAFIVGKQYRAALDAPGDDHPESFDAWLRSVGAEIGCRIQIVGATGKVLFDTADPPEVGVNLRERSEIAQALTGAYSARSRLTADRQRMFFHIARPIKDDSFQTFAIAYITRDTHIIMLAIKRMLNNQRLATWLALALAAVAATVLSLTLTRRLRALTRAAKRFAQGSGPLDTPLRGGDEIAELDRALHEMADELATRHRYNRDFVRTTLHELRTPLTAIKGAAEILRDGVADRPDARRRFTENILHQTDRLMRLVGELRELTRIDAELRSLPAEPLDYFGFLREAIARLEETFPEPRAALRVEIPDEPARVLMVPHRIEQVLSNLLENAFRFTPPSGTVAIRSTPGENRTVLTCVEDTGPGIRPDDLPRIFDQFFTTERRDAPSETGSGLGLAIAQSIVRNHRGRIWAESQPGNGARFFVELPLA